MNRSPTPKIMRMRADEPKGISLPAFLKASTRIGALLAILGLVICAGGGRWDWFLGLLLGSSLSLFNFHWLGESARRWLSPEKGSGTSGHWKGFLLRLTLSGVILGLAIRYLPLNLWGLAIGLFAAQGGLLLGWFLQGTKLEEG